MRRIFAILFAGLLIAAIAAPAFAWEFSMKGSWEERVLYFSQTGPNGLFGNMNLQNGGAALPDLRAGMGLAGPNFYGNNPVILQRPADTAAGVTVVRAGFSEYDIDARFNQVRLRFHPVVRVNKAIRVFGVYNVGGYRNINARYDSTEAVGVAADGLLVHTTPGTPPYEQWQTMRIGREAYLTAAVGSWEQVRATIQTPWAILSIGAKDFPLGVGSNTAYNTRADAFLAIVPYGPFRILGGHWWARGDDGWNVTGDKSNKTEQHWLACLLYDSGPLSLGFSTIQVRDHMDATSSPFATGTDGVVQIYQTFLKYNNGRFFTNAEYNWVTTDFYRQRALPINREQYSVFAEAGFFAGPMKLSLLWTQASGPVLNDGNATKDYRIQAINYQCMEPYEYLMFYTYGGGNDQYHVDGNGQMGDAYAFAARADYAVASNVNVWGSYMWAHRLEVAGYPFGWKNPIGEVATAAEIGLFRGATGRLAPAGGGNPYVSDGFLGWEANVGVDWKLLEGMTWSMRYAYWQPGDWFREAYQCVGPATDETYVAPTGTTAETPYAYTDPVALESRDAIHAFKGAVVIDF